MKRRKKTKQRKRGARRLAFLLVLAIVVVSGVYGVRTWQQAKQEISNLEENRDSLIAQQQEWNQRIEQLEKQNEQLKERIKEISDWSVSADSKE